MYITGNMPFILICAICIFSVWVIFVIKGLCVRRSNALIVGGIRDIFLLNSHGFWMINFAVRFYYEVFLVLCISSLISLRKDTQEHAIPELNKEHDPDAQHAKTDRALAIIMLLIIVLSILYASWRVFRRYHSTANVRLWLMGLLRGGWCKR